MKAPTEEGSTMLRAAACFGLLMLPATAFAQQSLVQQPPWLAERPTAVEAAASSFADCVSRQIRMLPASLDTQTAAAQVAAKCDAPLATVEGEATRIIERSSLSEDRKAIAIRDLRKRLTQATQRIAMRVDRRRASLQ
jgi:hypothetical protein